jgi:L-lactate dehydrogenase
MPVSTLTIGQYGIEGIYLSLPCVVGRNGIEKVIEIPLSDDEKEGLIKSAEILKKIYKQIT